MTFLFDSPVVDKVLKDVALRVLAQDLTPLEGFITSICSSELNNLLQNQYFDRFLVKLLMQESYKLVHPLFTEDSTAVIHEKDVAWGFEQVMLFKQGGLVLRVMTPKMVGRSDLPDFFERTLSMSINGLSVEELSVVYALSSAIKTACSKVKENSNEHKGLILEKVRALSSLFHQLAVAALESLKHTCHLMEWHGQTNLKLFSTMWGALANKEISGSSEVAMHTLMSSVMLSNYCVKLDDGFTVEIQAKEYPQPGDFNAWRRQYFLTNKDALSPLIEDRAYPTYLVAYKDGFTVLARALEDHLIP